MKFLTALIFSATAGLMGLVAAHPAFEKAARDLTFSARDAASDQVEARGVDGYAQALPQARAFDADGLLKPRDVFDTTLDARGLDLAELEPRYPQTDEQRSRYTVNIVSYYRAKYPHYNVVVCHTKHHYQFNGDQGHVHQELYELPEAYGNDGPSIGYDIYWFQSGTFVLDGDGGFINWAYDGNVQSRNGGTVVFGTL